MNNKKNNKGFSLVELIVVVAIMAVLVGVLAPAYLQYVEKSRAQKDVSAVAEVIEAVKVVVAEEDVAKAITGECTITVSDGSIDGTADSVVKDAVKKVVKAPAFTSKTHGVQKYTINIALDSDNVITVEDYAVANWSAVSVSPSVSPTTEG